MDRSGSPPEELFAAAQSALASGRQFQAHGLLAACSESGHPDYAARADAMLAELAMARGDAEGAERMARSAMERGTGEGRATAAISLAGFLLARGESAEAERLYREVMDTGGESAAWATFNLGVLFTLTGDAEEAISALRKAIATGDPEAAPRAEVNLGILQATLGDPEAARATFEAAAERDHPEQRAKARLNLLILQDRYLATKAVEVPDNLGERLMRVATLQTEAGHLLLASARGQRDPILQLSLYVSLLDIADEIRALSRTPEELSKALDPCRGAVRIGEMLAKRYPNEPSNKILAPFAMGRLGDLHLARGAVKDARKWYTRAHKTAVKTAASTPEAAVGPLQAARACWQLTQVERPDRVPALLDEAEAWLTTATEREPSNAELPYERDLVLWHRGLTDPERAPDAATQIIEHLGTREGRLPPRPAEALTWARRQTD